MPLSDKPRNRWNVGIYFPGFGGAGRKNLSEKELRRPLTADDVIEALDEFLAHAKHMRTLANRRTRPHE